MVRPSTREQVRKRHNIEKSFLIVTDGKIDLVKAQIILLMEAVKQLDLQNVKLLVFGSVVEELRDGGIDLVDNNKIQYIGWIDSDEAYNYFATSELVVFSGRHSVF